MKKRIKWDNVFLTIIFILTLGLVLSDIFYLFIYPVFTSKLFSWTWVGFGTFGFSLTYVILFIEYFIEEVK